MEEKKLFLLDAYALIYRAYYGLMRNPMTTMSGLNTSAIFGFVNTLEEVLRKENPAYMAVCFDPPGGHTFRHERYPDYKAGRDKQPEDITLAVPYIKSIIEAYGIKVVEVPDYEADDVIGTLSKMAAGEGFTTYMMTLDKDYGQLVSDSVLMYRPALKGQGFEVRGPKEICAKHNISSPRQVIDLLALEGDSSDNIPGCPGVGAKTAAGLIDRFGSVDNLLASTDSLTGALREKIVSNADLIRLSKELVTIATDAPVGLTPDALRRTEPDAEALVRIFNELEFKSFAAKWQPRHPDLFSLPESEAPVTPTDGKDALDLPADVAELTDPADVTDSLRRAIASGTVAIAINSVGPEAMTAAVYGVALAWRDRQLHAAYIPFPGETGPRRELAALLEPLFSSSAVTVVSADVKRDMILLRREGVSTEGPSYYDTAVAHYLCSPEMRHDTATLAMHYFNFRTYDYDYRPADRTHAPMDAPGVMGQTAAVLLSLKPQLDRELAEKGQDELLRKVEFPLIPVLADMEWTGVRIDIPALQAMHNTFSDRLRALEDEAFAIAGHPFNVSSPSQVGTVLFDEMGIDPKAKKTKGGSWSTAEDVLEKYRHDVPLVRLILDIRGLRKLLATYIDALPRLVNPRDGKIHTTYNQTVTATGRISSSNPNLQNIPVRSDDGRDIRAAFVADPGDLLLSVDYSQIELRLMADLSGDPSMIEAFLSGTDIHRATAAKIYHIDPDDVTDNQRRNAKTANFGIIYGISAFGLSERLGIPRGEARDIIDGYLATYPGVAEYMKKSIEHARENGFVTTVMGRRRYLPDINSRSNTVRSFAERNAINAPLQGTAADIIKLAMVRIARRMKELGLRSRMIMQVHDELVFNVAAGEADTLVPLVTDEMRRAYDGRVPMDVSAGLAPNWLEAH